MSFRARAETWFVSISSGAHSVDSAIQDFCNLRSGIYPRLLDDEIRTCYCQETRMAMEIDNLSITDILQIGLMLVGFDERQRQNCFAQLVTWFRASYGVHPLVYAVLWWQIREIDSVRSLRHFFMCLNWLKCYSKEAELAGRFNLSDKTVRKWCMYYARTIGTLFDVLIIFPTVAEMGEDLIIGVVDGLHAGSYEPRVQHPEFPFDKGMKSHKLNKAGFAWEIVLDLTGKPIWVNGPFKAGKNDTKVYNEEGLKGRVPQGRYLLGDLGYQGVEEVITANKFETYEEKAFKRKHRARIEHYNGRLKSFGALKETFRHKGGPVSGDRFEKHKIVMHAINVIVFLSLENGFPLYEP